MPADIHAPSVSKADMHTHTHTSHTTYHHTTSSHATCSHTNSSHTTYSHTASFLLAHADPSPSLFSFLHSPCHLYLSFAACWKKLTCGVIRSFNFIKKASLMFNDFLRISVDIMISPESPSPRIQSSVQRWGALGNMVPEQKEFGVRVLLWLWWNGLTAFSRPRSKGTQI